MSTKTCSACQALKTKCVRTDAGGPCDRCTRLGIEASCKAIAMTKAPGGKTDPLVGRAVMKLFEGRRYNGIVAAFDSPYYVVEYSDGDTEDLDRGELSEVLVTASNDNATAEPMVGRVVRKSFGGKHFLGSVVDRNEFYTVLYEDGDHEDLTRHELAKVLFPDEPLQLRMDIDSAGGEPYLYVLTRNNDKPSEIAKDFGCPEMIDHILALNKQRYSALSGDSRLESGTRILVPDSIAQVLRNGSALVCKQVASAASGSLSDNRAIFGICQVCDCSTLKAGPGRADVLECASLGCGAKLHRACDKGAREGTSYFCPSCRDVPLEMELFDIAFKNTKFDGQLRFGSSSGSARVASFGIVNSRSHSKGVTMSAHSAGVESERMMIKLCAFVKEQAPDLKFTSFVVNLNTKFSLHVDTENVGLGGIVGFGDYQGGDLWAHWLPEEGKVRGGTRFHDVRARLLVINGAAPHMTTKFKGRRLTVVLYTRRGFEACDTASMTHLKSVGFQLPDSAYMKKWGAVDNGDVEYRLLAAIKDLVKDQRTHGS